MVLSGVRSVSPQPPADVPRALRFPKPVTGRMTWGAKQAPSLQTGILEASGTLVRRMWADRIHDHSPYWAGCVCIQGRKLYSFQLILSVFSKEKTEQQKESFRALVEGRHLS